MLKMELVDDGQRLIVKETGDGREVSVTPRIYNTIVTIGPIGAPIYDEHW